MRTELGKVTALGGKWSVSFINWNGPVGNEYISSTIESAHVLPSEDEAYAAGRRALAMLKETGMFPNMCEPF